MHKTPIAVIAVLLLLLLGIAQSFYTVDETQRGIILQLGEPVGEVVGPGLHFKLPFMQNVVLFDHRVQEYDAKPAEVITKDKKNLVVDNYARWRISDPLLFYRTSRTLKGGVARLDDIVYSELRVSLGRHDLIEIVSNKRDEIMKEVTKTAGKDLAKYGIELLDVRIKRTDLPEENQKAIFARMSSERERQAKQYRAEGREEAAKIRAEADKDRAIMLAEAERKAEVQKGEGDAEATKIYGNAYKQDPDFYSFVRSLKAYQQGLTNGTSLVLTPESKFLEYMR